jgi:hypothetical protein
LWQRSGLENGRGRAHIQDMIENASKLVRPAVLLLTTGWPWAGPRYGTAIALGVIILAAVVLHFAAP